MKLQEALKTSLQELRMQMLGAQVLFGFQLQGLFQDNFEALAPSARTFDAMGLVFIVTVIALVIAVPCQHRLVERGESSLRIYRISMHYAVVALVPLAGAIGCDVYAATRQPYGPRISAIAGACALMSALLAWFGLGWVVRRGGKALPEENMERTKIALHAKIDQMLTEARVVLPGAQALLGFQLIVMMTQSFGTLPAPIRWAHLAALMALALTIALLIAPAAIHRLGFKGRDDPRMHSISSMLITIAMLPLAAAISCDVWVALTRLIGESTAALLGAITVLASLLILWFAVPLALRRGERE
jgi:hypothetical protein